MNSRNDIQRELEQISSNLPYDAKTPVFDLPEGYFENFASGVLAIVRGESAASVHDELTALSPLLAGLSRQTPFAVPQNYFQENIMLPPVAAANEELPAWMQHSRSMPFAVPEGYFENLSASVQQQLAPEPQAKVVSMFSRNWMRYAAAAVVGGALVLATFLFSNEGNHSSPASQPQAWVEKKLQHVSSEELDDFIETADLAGTGLAQKKSKSRPEVRRMLKDVPVSELEAFLEQVPAGAENLN